MRVALGADHAGVGLKDQLKQRLDERGFGCLGSGTTNIDETDHPDVVPPEAARGIRHAVLDTPSAGGRPRRRLDRISALDQVAR